MYLFHPVMVRYEVMLCQDLYCIGNIDAVWKKGSNCDTCQGKKRSDENMVNYQLRKLMKYHRTKSVYI